MQTLLEKLRKKFKLSLEKIYGQELVHMPDLLQPEVVQSTQAQFGHYQCNNGLKLSKTLKKNPREIAQEILTDVISSDKSLQMIHKMEIAGPGFINITLDNQFISQEVDKILIDSRLGIAAAKPRKRIIVEFSSPNIAKELHVGHLRSTIIGDCLARLFEFFGHDVLRLNHIGDWGTQFGMLIAYLQENRPEVLTGEKKTDLAQLMQWYKESKKLFDSDEAFKKRAQKQVVRLQGGDEASLEAWQMICEISRQAFQEIYDLLDVKIQERGESFYNPYLAEVVADLEKKELVTLSNGAKCIFLEGFVSRDGAPLPMIIQKSDGGYNYDTTDVAAMRHRVEFEKAERIIIVTDAGQSLHFQMVEKVAEKAGYLDPLKVRFDHVPFGVVLGADGKKFKTRSGETEKLIDLIYEAIDQAKNIFKERLPHAPEDEVLELAKTLGVDAIKYADLSSHRLKDYVFSYERMLKFEGNTAAFLLYSFVRIQSIKRKVGKEVGPLIGQNKLDLQHLSEIALGIHIRQFDEVLENMARDLLPNRLCDYLYELAEKFNAFFRDCRVEGSLQEDSRLLLCEATGRTLEKGLNILGLKVIEKM